MTTDDERELTARIGPLTAEEIAALVARYAGRPEGLAAWLLDELRARDLPDRTTDRSVILAPDVRGRRPPGRPRGPGR